MMLQHLFGLSCYVAMVLTKDTNLFEGDIVLSADAIKVMKGGSVGYDGATNKRMHWPNGIVPYVFSSGFDSGRTAAVKRAMSDYHARTCIRFKQRTVERDYVNFMIGGGCYSNIGRTGGAQDLSIGQGCTSHGTVVHELMHAIGFWHEQSRLDRDNYINIYWNNIESRYQYAFAKYSHGEADYYGAGYDLDSVMHYDRYSFGNGKVTIAAKNDYNRRLGSNGFTSTDLMQINKMYKCSGTTGTSRPKTVKPSGNCVDRDTSCSYWASIGECQKSADYMKANCKKSCKLCSASSCKDSDSNCREYKGRGYCTGTKFLPWMKTNCKRTCNIC